MLIVKNEIVFGFLFYVFYVCVQTGVKTQRNTINVPEVGRKRICD